MTDFENELQKIGEQMSTLIDDECDRRGEGDTADEADRISSQVIEEAFEGMRRHTVEAMRREMAVLEARLLAERDGSNV